MATWNERLAILISADGRGATRELQQVGNTAEKELGRATSSADRFSARAVRTGTVMVGAAAVIGIGLASTVRSALESERANLLLQNTIKKMPALAGANKDAFLDQATALQKVTAASDEQIVSAQAMLGTFQLTQKQILGITPLVVDFSRKFGVDMVDASKQVGKALEGQIGSLKRQGISIDENLYKTDRYAAVMKALREQAGGFAEEEGKTFEGQLIILSNQADEFKESVGRGVVGVLTDILPAATSAAGALGTLDEQTGGTVGKFATFGVAALGVAGAMSLAAGTAVKLSPVVRGVGSAFSTFEAALTGTRAAAAATATANSALAASNLEVAATANTAAAAQGKFRASNLGVAAGVAGIAVGGKLAIDSLEDLTEQTYASLTGVEELGKAARIAGNIWKIPITGPGDAVEDLIDLGKGLLGFGGDSDKASDSARKHASAEEVRKIRLDNVANASRQSAQAIDLATAASQRANAAATSAVGSQLAWEAAIRAQAEAQAAYVAAQTEADAAGGRNIELNNAATAALIALREQINQTALAAQAKAEQDAGPNADATAKTKAGTDAYRASLAAAATSEIPAVRSQAQQLLLILAAYDNLNPTVRVNLDITDAEYKIGILQGKFDSLQNAMGLIGPSRS